MTSGRIYKVEAIVLTRRNTGEADRVLTLFTKEYGKIRAIAKGIRKIQSHRGPHAEVFNRVIAMLYQGKTPLDLVNEITPLETYQMLRKYLDRVNTAYFLCELIDRMLPERQEHRDVFTLLTRELRRLDDLTVANTTILREEFARELLRELGFLEKNKLLAGDELEEYIESIIQRHLRTPKILRRLSK